MPADKAGIFNEPPDETKLSVVPGTQKGAVELLPGTELSLATTDIEFSGFDFDSGGPMLENGDFTFEAFEMGETES